jgi:CubicO group peptidase (beta-lactamase class C family)
MRTIEDMSAARRTIAMRAVNSMPEVPERMPELEGPRLRLVTAARRLAGLEAIEARRPIERLLAAQIALGHLPGATYLLVRSDGPLLGGQLGLMRHLPAPEVLPAEAIYDVASLTKPVITATVAMLLAERGELDLGALVGRYVAAAPWGERMTVEDLLLHTSGLPAWRPLYADPAKEPLQMLLEVPLRFKPHERAVYSCLGYVLLGHLLECAAGRSLRELGHELILGPLGMRASFFSGEPIPAPVVPTEMGNVHEVKMMRAGRGIPLVRAELIEGEVHDTNAYALGGLPGNAGLFSTADDLGLYASALLRSLRGQPGLLRPETAAEMIRVRAYGSDEARSYGWLVQDRFPTSAGAAMGPRAFGHTSFTGCSLFFDPERDLAAILLTNRVHPRLRPTPMHEIRRRFHDLACAAADELAPR